MTRILLALFLLSSCASFTGTKEAGGEQRYVYDNTIEYTSEELVQLAPGIVKTFRRDPQSGKLDELFKKENPDLKRIGLIVFESKIQSTIDGLAGNDKVYLSPQGKQVLTEKLLTIWNQSLPLIGHDFDYVSISQMKNSKALHEYGVPVKDYVLSKRDALAPDDIFYLPKGKLTTSTTTLNARGMQDVSFLLVPGAELMQGPKFSEHNKHFVNDVARELRLDGVIIVMSDVSWTAARMDKHSGEMLPEEVNVKIKTSTLIPLSQYHERLKKVGGENLLPNTTLCFRAYEAQVKVPVLLSVPVEDENFASIEKELLNPMLKTYKDLAQMTITRMLADMRTTH